MPYGMEMLYMRLSEVLWRAKLSLQVTGWLAAAELTSAYAVAGRMNIYQMPSNDH